MRSLTDLGGADAHDRAANLGRRGVQLDGRRRLFRKTERIADVLDSARDADSTPQRVRRFGPAGRQRKTRRLLFEAPLEDRPDAHAGWKRMAGRLDVAFLI